MQYKKYLNRLAAMTLSALLLIMGFNFHTDTYGVFKGDFSKLRWMEPNQHFVKMNYILQNKDKYHSFLFGSSRVGNIDVRQLSGDFYNMTYSEGLPKEWMDDLGIMLENGMKMDCIMIGIDEFSFRVDPQTHSSQLMRTPYQQGDTSYYLKNLMKIPTYEIKELIKSLSTKGVRNGVFYDIYDTGRLLHQQADARIEANVEEHLRDSKFNVPVGVRGNRIRETLDEIKQIKEYATENKIKLIVFINPIHKTTYLDTNLDEFNAFKKGLVEITDYYDFSGLNEVTTNNYYYYESSHYRPIVGDMIIERLFRASAQRYPIDFGAFVTKDTIEAHVAGLMEQIE